MRDLRLVITRCKRYEGLLTRRFGATGRGLHEKLTSVENRLPLDVVRKLRFVATVRNKLVHEEEYSSLDDRAGFLRACRDIEHALDPGTTRRRRIMAGVLIALVLIVLGAIVVWWNR